MLTYTFNNLLTEQAVIERDVSVPDAYGATVDGSNWQYLSTVPCRLWWDRSSGVRSANRTYVTPARTVPMDEGALLMPLGTDVLEVDRISVVNVYDAQTRNWVPYVEGNFTITAVLVQEDHMEIDVIHSHLGEN